MSADKIDLLPCVRFKCIPIAFYPVITILIKEGKAQGFTPMITGAAYEKYSPGGYHARGFAWDIRILNVPDPLGFAVAIYNALTKGDNKYRILYGDKNHIDHIHIEYRYDLKEMDLLRGK